MENYGKDRGAVEVCIEDKRQSKSTSEPNGAMWRSFLTKIALSVLSASVVVVLFLATSSLVRVKADENDDDDNGSYSIGLWGDLPYSDLQATTGVPNLIADMNRQHLAFSVNDGDLKGGNGTPGSTTPTICSDALYTQGLGFFNSLRSAAIFTPGDNDWTDCDRPSNGGFNSLERLDHERQVFFSNAFSLGQHPLRQEIQTASLCLNASHDPAPCVENRRWSVGRVIYVTLNVQGSCNNLCDTDPDPIEYAARNSANIAWMNETFDLAEETGAVAVMIISQADPGFNTSDIVGGGPLRNPKTLVETDVPAAQDGYIDFLLALRTRVIEFRRPVAYVHGDSHYARIDKPFQDSLGRRLENFTRVETFGDNAANGNNDVNWLKVIVDPHSREVFAYQPQIVPSNRTAVTAPTPFAKQDQ